jgi:multiple sugar transport system substrate-binding protein
MNKPWARRAIGAGIALAVGVALTGCGSSGGGDASVSGDGDYTGPKVQISFWNGWTGGAAPVLVPKLIEKFNSEHDNIEVKNVPQEWADIASKMPLAIKAGKGPDVAVLHGDDLATYAAQKLLLPSDDIAKNLDYSAEDFPKGVFDKGSYKDTQYALPWSVTPLGLYINKDVAAKAGITEVPTDKASYTAALDALKGGSAATSTTTTSPRRPSTPTPACRLSPG